MSLNFKLIGRRVKEIRNLKQMSQAELAEQIDKSVPYISHIETATKQASLTTLVQIANSVGIANADIVCAVSAARKTMGRL